MKFNTKIRDGKRALARAEKYSKFVKFDNVLSAQKLYEASMRCTVGYNWKSSVQQFNLMPYVNCLKISNEIAEHTYKPKKLRKFKLNERGKLRLIQPISFQDRVIQHSICKNCLEPILYPLLVYDNSASQKGKGTNFALKRFEKHLNKARKKFGDGAYVVQVDIKNYFGSISSTRVCEMLEYELMRVALSDEEVHGANEISGLIKLFLLSSDHLELGNQLSQIGAVFFINKLDHYVIEKLGVSLYGRYMDDIYAICKDKEEAVSVLNEIIGMLPDFGLKHHEGKSKIVPISSKLVFLKTVFQFGNQGLDISIPSKTIRRHKRHYKHIAKLVRARNAPEYSLSSCRAAFKGVVMRETLLRQRTSLAALELWYESIDSNLKSDQT